RREALLDDGLHRVLSRPQASLAAAILEAGAQRSETLLLRRDVRISGCLRPQARVLGERVECRIVLVGRLLELLGRFFIRLLPDFPDLSPPRCFGLVRARALRRQRWPVPCAPSAPSKATSYNPLPRPSW